MAHRESKDYYAPKLLGTRLPQTQWIVPELLPEGLTILVGKRKSGKSWLALNLANAVAEGDDLFEKFEGVDEGSVFYAAFEDVPGRMQLRQRMVNHDPSNSNLTISVFPPRAPALIDKLNKWADAEANPRLVILDVLQMAWPVNERITNYERTYDILAKTFGGFANDRHVAIVAVHHPTKGKNQDPLDSIRGAGIAEAADTLWVLKRDPVEPHADLYVVGRDIEEEQLLAIEFSRGKWTAVDNVNPSHQAIRMVIVAAGGKGLTPKEAYDRLAKNGSTLTYEYVKKTLLRMKKHGKMIGDQNSRYREP